MRQVQQRDRRLSKRKYSSRQFATIATANPDNFALSESPSSTPQNAISFPNTASSLVTNHANSFLPDNTTAGP
jgi:hypothetical protein